MRNVFSNWFRGEYAWVIAPLAIWMSAWLLNTVFQMIRQKRLLHPLLGVREAGWIWKGTFLAAIAWALVWVVVLGASSKDGS